MLAALLFITMSASVGLTASHLINVAFWRRILALAALTLAGTISLYV
jgi:hypothetical protein